MHILIDADIITYRAGFGAQSKNPDAPLEHSLYNVKSMIRRQLRYLKKMFDIDDVTLFLTADDGSNFRYNVAVTQPYKGNRKDIAKPKHYHSIREYIQKNYKCIVVYGQEADDEMGIVSYASKGQCVIVSADKDMRMIPGWHWEMGERPPYFVEDPGYLILERLPTKRVKLFGTGMAWFYAQCLMGDTADHIPGLKGMGDVRTYNILADCVDPEEMRKLVIKQYKKYNKSEAELEEIEELLWIRREPSMKH